MKRLGVLHQLHSQLGAELGRERLEKLGVEIKNLEIIRACHAICRRIEKDLTLTHSATHVGAEGNELADRMAMLGVQRKEKQTATGSG